MHPESEIERMASYSKVVWRKLGTVPGKLLPLSKVFDRFRPLTVMRSPALVFKPLKPTFVCFSQLKATMNLKLLYSLSGMLMA